MSSPAERLSEANRAFAARYPGESERRQPVHTVYGGAHLFRADAARKLGDAALRALDEFAPDPAALAGALGLPAALAPAVHERVREKLRREPVEDFRIDFEDGYGNRADAEEDGHAAQAAEEAARGLAQGSLPPFLGIRIKPLTEELRARSVRTLERFLRSLVAASGGRLPPGFAITLPKVTAPEQPAFLARWLDELEPELRLPRDALRLELMVETPQAIVGPDGTCPLPRLVEAARGRAIAAHFGTYDYTSGLGITAAHQRMDHPACDFARHAMQVALAGTGVWLSDGATNVLPIPPHRATAGAPPLAPAAAAENRAVVHRAWRLHYDHVRHSLAHAYYQGWDLHPAQLPTRYAAVYAFFLESLPAATTRLRNFMEQAGRATLVGDVFDDAATGQGLVNFFLRALNCGAITEAEALRTGLTVEELRMRSFVRILRGRQASRAPAV
jgi:hypothetical protein